MPQFINKRLMLDTNVINKLCNNKYDLDLVIKSTSRGYKYFLTDVQCDELKNTIHPHRADPEAKLVETNLAELALKLPETALRIKPDFLKQVTTRLDGSSKLDGSHTFYPSSDEQPLKMYDVIWNKNPTHKNDAMIAMVAILNNCILITAESRLYNRVNEFFPGHAILYKDFQKSL